MVTVRPVPDDGLESARRMHNQYTASDVSPGKFREWRRSFPDLVLGAYAGQELVGYCLGVPGYDSGIELKAIAVRESYRRQGIASSLLDTVEENARRSGFERLSLGSAGGYVDEFYLANGYEPESILVRFETETIPEQYRDLPFDVIRERVDDGRKKLYVDVDEFDPAFLDSVRDAYDDPEAIHIMTKAFD